MSVRRRGGAWWAWLLGWAWLWAACAPLPPTATPTLTPRPPTATPSPTATPVRFPPTSTPTPLPPTLPPLPTPDPFAGRGALLVDDPLTEGVLWAQPPYAKGTLTVTGGRLTLEVPSPPGVALALRETPEADDFILLTRVRPRLCRGRDAYGVVLRADAKGRAFYRLGVTCAGEVFAEYVDGAVVVPLQPPQAVPLPTTFPVEVPLSVWVRRGVVRMYLHGALVLEVDYPTGRRKGRLGAFARAVEAPVAVDFLRWQVWAVEGGGR